MLFGQPFLLNGFIPRRWFMTCGLKVSIPLIVALTCAGFSHPAKAADTNAYLYIAHAASGRNISSTTNPAYPVDISIAGFCIAKGISFGDIQGPFTLGGGTYPVKVSVANSANPCGLSAVFNGTITMSSGTTELGILTLDASNHLTGLVSQINLSSVPWGKGRTAIYNATLDSLGATLTAPDGTKVGEATVAPGKVLVSDNPPGIYTGTIFLPGPRTVETGPVPITLSSRNLSLVVLGGSTTNASVQLIGPKVIWGVL
jgi:hypothetical protein